MDEEPLAAGSGHTLVPLTHRTTSGLLHREREVDSQILMALSLDRARLIARLELRDFEAEGYLQEECLVYLLRNFRCEGTEDLVNELMSRLVRRIAKHVHNNLSKVLHVRFVNDAFGDVLEQMTGRLLDVASDRDDYAQFRFWHWLDRMTMNTVRPHIKRQADEIDTESLDDLREHAKVTTQLQDYKSPTAHDQLLCAEALQILEPHERAAFLLRHYEGWDLLTISKHFNRTSKTIYNWLQSADRKLQAWRGGTK